MKKNNKLFLFLMLISFTGAVPSFAQQLNQKDYLKKVTSKTSALNKRINNADKKYVRQYLRADNKMHRKLCRTNPELADKLFSYNSDPFFYHQRSKNNLSFLPKDEPTKEYFAEFDTAKTTSQYLQSNHDKAGREGENTLSELKKADEKLNSSERLHQFFRQRKTQVKQAAERCPELKKSYHSLDKVNYYYGQQVSEYKKIFADKSKAKEAALKLIRNNNQFKEFMQKNGQLASLRKLKANPAGLQTMAGVKELMQKDVAALGINPKQILDTKMQPMTEDLAKLKSGRYGNTSNAADVPDFKPNQLKTKRLVDRLEYGTDFSFANTNNFFPASSNIGAQLGYKLIKANIVGIGASYCLGMGSSWNHIHASNQGISLRSFVDIKIKPFVYLEGGYEKNYKAQMQTETHNPKGMWYDSALLGLKFRKSTAPASLTLTLLYDFLNDQHYPKSPAFIYRVGWDLKK
jgi:hypothetical protein